MKRKCEKGFSCGSSCINVGFECSINLSANAVSTSNRMTDLVISAKKTGYTPNPKKPSEGEHGSILSTNSDIVIKSKYNDISIDSEAKLLFGDWFLSFKVNESFNAIESDSLTKKDKLNISKIARYDMERILEALPEKAHLIQAPHGSDGKGERRASLYKRFGFGEVDSDGNQWANKINGIITPANE